MSKNLPEKNQPSEEIDLGQLFKLIGNAFERLFKFIGNIFYKLFLVFVWGVFFTKRHFLKLAIAVVIGAGLGFVKKKIESPVFNSTIVIKQNFRTGEHLFNTVNYYNSLIQQKDSIGVSDVLSIDVDEANKIVGLEMNSNITENEKIQLYDNYLKTLDSALATTIKYKDYVQERKDYNYSIQKLTLKTNTKGNFNKVLLNIIKNIEENEYYNELKLRRIDNLYRQDSVIEKALLESKDLQDLYKEILQREENDEIPSGGTTNIAIGGAQDKKETKEMELFGNDLKLRREIISNESERRSLTNIIEVISNPDGEGIVENQAKIFGMSTSWSISLAIKIGMIVYVILLLLEFIKFLERYKDEVS